MAPHSEPRPTSPDPRVLRCTIYGLTIRAWWDKTCDFGLQFGPTTAVKLMRMDQIRSKTARAEGPGSLGPDFGPSTLALRRKSAQNQPRKPGPGTGSTTKRPKVWAPSGGRSVGSLQNSLRGPLYTACAPKWVHVPTCTGFPPENRYTRGAGVPIFGGRTCASTHFEATS